MIVRPATEADCRRIAEITNQAIASGVAHFGTEPDDPADIAAQWRRDNAVYPWFVADGSGAGEIGVMGFCRAARWKSRAAYDWTCETAVYIDPACHGRGVGRLLYERLFAELERRGFRCLLGGMTLPNPASERLHAAMGMEIVGTLPAVGFKMGAWHDVRYYVKTLGDGSRPAEPPGVRDS